VATAATASFPQQGSGELVAVRAELEQIRQQLDDLLAERTGHAPDPQVLWRQELQVKRQQEDEAATHALMHELHEARSSLSQAEALRKELHAARSGMERAEAEKFALATELESLKVAFSRMEERRLLPQALQSAKDSQRSPSSGRTAEQHESSPHLLLPFATAPSPLLDPLPTAGIVANAGVLKPPSPQMLPQPLAAASAYACTLENVLDVFYPCVRELSAIRAALGEHRSTEARSAVVAEAIAKSALEAGAILPHVRENMRLSTPFLPRVESILRHILDS